MNSNIYILSAPIRSGKTTALMEFWEMGMIDMDGFITPEINELRKLIFLDTEEEFDFEVEENSGEKIIQVGPFKFSVAVFESTNKKIKSLINSKAKLIVIDEIGRLEMEGMGFEPALNSYIELFKKKESSQILILVIRNSLLVKAIEKYELDDSPVLSLDLFRNQFIGE
jgi:nucleoside-triphosphatase THEP1